MMPWEKSRYADRGKVGEEKLKDVLETNFGSRTDSGYYRLPDYRAGSKQPTLADYLLTHKGTTYLLEAKETQHENRLPHGNFDKAQIARMRKFSMAGMVGLVTVYHEKLDRWRVIPLDFFFTKGGGSWFVTDFPLVQLKDVLRPADQPGSILHLEPQPFLQFLNAPAQ